MPLPYAMTSMATSGMMTMEATMEMNIPCVMGLASKQMGATSRVHVHQTYLVDDILLSIEDPELRFRCLYPPMMRLLAEDEQNPGDLMRTLRCYVEDPSHPAEVAKRLFIHKNTLYFRLDKIRQIMGCDLHDGETIAKIVLTFHLLRMQKRLDLEGGEG